jgi:hypothetical protein
MKKWKKIRLTMIPVCRKKKNSNYHCKDLSVKECKEREDMGHCILYYTKDRGLPGKGSKYDWIKEPGSLTKIFLDAGIKVEKGSLIDGLTEDKCKKMARWAVNNVKKWNEKGKDPQKELSGKFAGLFTIKSLTLNHQLCKKCL